jgi:BirA family biotin operon repressor/biotin-[acetyl-CoA-carboxylase] ligase
VAVLSIRIGLHVAPVLDRHVAAPIQLKWPNDLYVGDGKLAGTLVETRWRTDRLDWVAIGFGLNVRPPEAVPHAASLVGVADRGTVLAELVPALRSAAAATGPLAAEEIDRFAARDLARGRACREPARGIVQGLDAQGALIVRTAAGDVACRTGSLVLEDDA